MNELLVRDTQTNFKVLTKLLRTNLDFNAVKINSRKTKPKLQAQILSKKVADLNLKQVKKVIVIQQLELLRVIISHVRNIFGFITQSSGQGFVYGVTATMVPFFFLAFFKTETKK